MRSALSILFVLSSWLLICQNANYSRVKIFTDHAGLQELANLGVAIDHGYRNSNNWFVSDFSKREIEIMRSNNFTIEILIEDVQKFYVNQSEEVNPEKNSECSPVYDQVEVPDNFNLGTMAGFYKYQEMLDELDQMAALYPDLITIKQQISTFQTYEGRPIYYVVISDNPTSTEAEPNVLYTAIHHAREPLGMTEVIFYMWYLLENYNSSDEVKYLVDNTQLFFVPCINPDGYIYNETTNPDGGGMHRKNRRPVGTTNIGVDLNRNYSYQWGQQGTSTDPDSDIYCGTGPFSEPETQAIKWLVETYGFKSALNAHTFGDLHLFPIGADAAEFADHHDYFEDLTSHQVEYNNFLAQKGTSLYPVSGGSDDYMYKENVGVGMKDTVFAMTPEIGPSFWPNQSLILPNCKKMIHPNLVLAHVPHKYMIVRDNHPLIIESTIGDFSHQVQRIGLEDGTVTISLEPLLNIQSVGPAIPYDLEIRESAEGTISYQLSAGIALGDEVKFVLNTDYGSWIKRDTISKVYGVAPIQVTEDANSLDNWIGTWSSTQSTFVSETSSYTDSPFGNYSNNANTTYMLDQALDLTTANAARASYFAKWQLEPSFDYVQFEVSTDNGLTWIPQCGNYTNYGIGNPSGGQPADQPLYDGFREDWVLEEIDLTEYLGEIIQVRFKLRSNGSNRYDGFYFDDFKLYFEDLSSINELEKNIVLGPNPASNLVQIMGLDEQKSYLIKIIDISGKTVKTEKYGSGNKVAISVSELAQGNYSVLIHDGMQWSKPVSLNIIR